MANEVTDPGFEGDGSAHTLVNPAAGLAEIQTENVFEGSKALRLKCRFGGPSDGCGGWEQQLTGLQLGRSYPFTARVNGVLAGHPDRPSVKDHTLTAFVQTGSGPDVFTQVGLLEDDALPGYPFAIPDEWLDISFGTFVPVMTSPKVRLFTSLDSTSGIGISQYDIDNVIVGVPTLGQSVAYRKWAVLDILRKKMLNISGGDYWHDIGDRVFFKLLLPEDDAATGIADPWISMPFDNSQQLYPEDGREYTRVVWRQQIYAYVRDPEANVLEGRGLLRLVADLEDDILKALKDVPTLAGTVHDSRIVESRALAGVMPSDNYGEVQVTLELDAFFGPTDLGPNAP